MSQQHSKPFFTKNPAELNGETLHTSLIKSPRGFGFTIVGGEERDEEFLQIKNVVPNGPAAQNGMLRTGGFDSTDVLVININLICVQIISNQIHHASTHAHTHTSLCK